MPKNLPIEVTKIEDFIMEDEKFNNLNSWVNHVVEDLGEFSSIKHILFERLKVLAGLLRN